jgi:hypothetical protein
VTKSDCIDITGDALKVPVKSSRFERLMEEGQSLASTVVATKETSTVLMAKLTNTTETGEE